MHISVSFLCLIVCLFYNCLFPKQLQLYFHFFIKLYIILLCEICNLISCVLLICELCNCLGLCFSHFMPFCLPLAILKLLEESDVAIPINQSD